MSTQHRNDIYGTADQPDQLETPAIPAATVILLRDSDRGVETLMLHRTSKVHFGGMWVFPGGRIDPEDYPESNDVNIAAQHAAVRETLEETGITIGGDAFAWFAHWTPPAGTPRRYATWFFASILETDQVIAVDGFEIQNHEWIQPAEALARHAAGEIDLAPPTWITLHQLALHEPAAALWQVLKDQPVRVYETRIRKDKADRRIALWAEDAAYAGGEVDQSGPRHRLVLDPDGFIFENTALSY
ncbi:MAG TPA: NUDIX hydrolase [Gammaproteobacteria bacterium]|jgi:8-oxo-dGTP pyrophosphatase MutT (NUDIX family)|nr:NUDIX hydrolase [Gammaproteobacteria bacterium]MDA0826954.1 NUDIX hydrolase [Pseudomonadota bacterium]MDA7591264.1 NUDIX hydrolase [Pseudomonadales bacterium]MDA8950852.1 NUDIX hydrolase [Pseudomonadales bacterium]MDB4567629.1 NUDIX hydrolase [Pseudomonadales bacterium]